MPDERLPDAVALEDSVAREVVARLRSELEQLTRRGLSLYESLDADNPEALRFTRDALARRISAISTNGIADGIREGVESALKMGAEDAARDLAVPVPDRVEPSSDLVRRIRDVETRARALLDEGAEAMRAATDLKDVEDAFGRARRSVSHVEREARSSVNTALSEGTAHVTEEHGAGRLWLAERDACVHCLAYAGEVAGPGEQFRAGLTFGAKALRTENFDGPPLHPNCRCRTVPYLASRDSGLVEAYKREALRSILRGFSLPSESEKTRLDAAERALRRGVNLPKSVQDYARRSLKRGHFDRGRTFPDSRAAVEKNRRREVVRREVSRGRDVRSTTRETETKARSAGLDTLPKRTPGPTANHEQRDALARVNPHYGEPGYGINCTHVVTAAELRRRGFDVEATALPSELWGARGRNMREVLNAWRTADGDEPTIRYIPSVGGLQTNTLKAMKAGGPGSRWWIVLAWKGGGAHVFSGEVDANGDVQLYDAQTHERVKPSDYFGRAKIANLIRVDDLVPGEGVLNYVKAATPRS